ncbi:MAG: phosphate/phosphite/phosphonate ABC transporter substrate-binding protein [bacterium]|nr:phosphate/phosphite/phosphonate ABC transporter substrate-binding protein [bacterium]
MRIKLALITTLLLFLFIDGVQAGTVFVFNPEGRIKQIRVVKKGLEKFFKSQGIDAKVYVFANTVDFSKSVRRLKPDIAIIASYYYTPMRRQYRWKAVLSGHYRGRAGFSKVLVTPKKITNPRSLNSKSIATVSLGESLDKYGLNSLGLSSRTVRVVAVSKDLDAIMALGFEQVQGAIVTRASFNQMKKINPQAVKNLKILKQLNQVAYPKVALFPTAKDGAKYIEALKKIRSRGTTKTALRYFGVTGFK